MFRLIKKINIFILLSFILFSCKKYYFEKPDIYNVDKYKVYDFGFSDDINIIVPKNQSIAQNLSIILKGEKNDVVVFDGGRTEDAEYLENIILENGGIVEGWYITHIHDDHIGALYNILNNTKIKINNIYYDFADFGWYNQNMSDDAGVYYLFEDAINKYAEKNSTIIHRGSFKKNKYSSFNVLKLNDVYKINDDPINNTSITYKVTWRDSSMIILGDLGYEGGELLIKNIDKKILKSDFVVVSHHGQNGVGRDVYKCISPKIAIWPTTFEIYNNPHKWYNTEETKEWLSDCGVMLNILSYEEDSLIK